MATQNMGFSEDQTIFREVVQRFLADKSPTTHVREMMASERGFDEGLWRQACSEVGLAGVHLPEEYGGSGFGPVELCIVAEEMGRALFCGPFFASSVMAGYAILNAGSDDDKQALLPGIADGSVVAALVLDDLNDVNQVGQSIVAKGADDSAALTGTARMVVDAHVADMLVVAASVGDEVALYTLPAKADGVVINAVTAMDATRKLSSVELTGAVATRLSGSKGARLDLLWDQMNTVLANELIGAADRLFYSTLDYMKLRVQFGRTIGSFQALKHKCADLLMELELARAAAHDAARAMAGSDGVPYAANMAKAMASDTSVEIAKAAIQLRGGIGFTWEEDTHLWFKRAKSSEVFLGTSTWHREQMILKLEASHV